MTATAPRSAVDRALGLASHFWHPASGLGTLQAVAPVAVPAPYRGLLDHQSHMTVAMEKHHGGPVRLRVLAVADGPGTGYFREILLEGPHGDVVQYGIVRIDLATVDPVTAAAIRAGNMPLGRLLIEAGLFRDVHDVSLLELQPGERLAGLFQCGDPSRQTFGRVAEIAINGKPAIELLEIAAPPRG